MEMIFMNTKNSETNEPYKFIHNLSERLDVKSLGKHVVLQNLTLYYTWKNIGKQYKNNKLKILTLRWNDEFELPDSSYSVSDLQDYIQYIMKKHETLTRIRSIHVYINRVNNILVLKIKDGYKLELQMPEIMKLFGSTKKLIEKTKNEEYVPSLEVAELVLVSVI